MLNILDFWCLVKGCPTSALQLQLCIGLRSMVFGKVKQSTIYAKFGESSCKKIDHAIVD